MTMTSWLFLVISLLLIFFLLHRPGTDYLVRDKSFLLPGQSSFPNFLLYVQYPLHKWTIQDEIEKGDYYEQDSRQMPLP